MVERHSLTVKMKARILPDLPIKNTNNEDAHNESFEMYKIIVKSVEF